MVSIITGIDANSGVDRYLAQRAKNNGKATRGLETLEFQIGLLDQLPKTDQEQMLRETHMDDAMKAMGMWDDWANGKRGRLK